MRIPKPLIAAIVACFTSLNLCAQISTNEQPYSFTSKDKSLLLKSSEEEVLVPLPIKMEQIEKEDMADEENGFPPRFGYPIPVEYNLENSGTWTTLDNGDRLWKLTIYSPGALSINLLYDEMWLPEGAKFYIYSTDKKHHIGAFTSQNNKGERKKPEGFATGLVYSDKVTLEYYEPVNVSQSGIIVIAYVIHGYKYINIPNNNISLKSFGGAGSCQVNINCSEGSNWQNEKNAVALILVDGFRYCTGSLISTTANDGRPLFLTADHCLGGWANDYIKYDAISNPNLSHWSFYWNYESPACINSYEPLRLSTTGAVVVANNDISDFALLRLTENPYGVYDVYYLGWDRSGSAGTGGVGIHHPNGDVKKIATHSYTPSTHNSYFWLLYWQGTANGYSVTEGGSSGSPLLNSSKRIIGQLLGGPDINCSNSSQDYAIYGKFNISWTGNNAADSRRRLRDWLDPLGTGTLTLDAPDITGSLKPYSFQPVVYSFLKLPVGATINWSSSSNVTFIGSTTGKFVNVKFCGGTTATLTAVVTQNGTSQTYSKTLQVNNGELTVAPRLGTMEVWLNHPYAQCYDWKIGSGLLTHINGSYTNGSFTCSNDNDLIFELSGLSGSQSVEVRAQANGCYTPWRAASFQSWAPEIKYEASYLNPMRPEPFYVALAKDYSGASNGAMYYWYFGNQLFDVTGEPYIHSSDWPCGEHTLRVVAVVDGYEAEASTDFWGMCSGWRYAAYPNPVSSLLTVSKQSEAATLSTLSATASVAEKLVSRKVQLYNASHHLVLEQSFGSATELTLNVAGLPNGTYFLNIFENGKVVEQQTVVVKR